MQLSVDDHLALDRFLSAVLEAYRKDCLSLLAARECVARAVVAAARQDQWDFCTLIRRLPAERAAAEVGSSASPRGSAVPEG